MTFIRRMDHFTVVTDKLAETRAFYEMLGLKIGPRPDFPVPGLWFYAAGHAVLHVLAVDEMPRTRRAVLDHMAFYGEDIAATLALLRSRGIRYRLIRAPRPYSTWQVFFEDPNGAEVEIDFDPEEQVPPHLKDGAGVAPGHQLDT
jgi:catechol 2,3-dioxygenase-like lactoylglutathione lyase family enzyme